METKIFLLITVCFGFVISSDVETAFREFEIVPDILKVAPKKLLQVTYSNGAAANLGNELTPTQVKDKPNITWEAEEDSYYTLIIVDPDIPSRLASKPKGIERPSILKYRELRLWTVMNIHETSVENGEEIVEYLESAPLKRTGLHRIMILVYKQPNGIIKHREHITKKKSIPHRLLTTPERFARKYSLGDPEFGNFYQVQYDEYSDILLMELIGLRDL